MSANGDLLYKFGRETELNNGEKGITTEEASKYLSNEDYETLFVEYVGDFLKQIKSVDYAHVYPLSFFFGILFLKKGRLRELLERFSEITKVERSFPFTLFNLGESNEKPDLSALSKGNIPLDGEGVIVGIAGTGIDYLSPKFMDKDGNTKIISIWDQTLSKGPIPESYFLGTVFTREEINKAIQAKKSGNNPYEIVQHRDEMGYGTAIANIIGGSKLGDSDYISSVAPKCEFIIVKLKETSAVNRIHWGLENFKGSVYQSNELMAAGAYLHEAGKRLNKPLVAYLPGGTNLGAHDGSNIGELFIDLLADGKDFSIVTSTGDQGGSPICLKESFSIDEEEKIISINIDENQENIFFSMYYNEPDVYSLGITSPLGETINKIPIEPKNGEELNITLGKSRIFIQYFLEGKNNNQRYDFVIKNAESGIWKINIIKEYAIYGTINIWLQQKEFSVGNTGLVKYTPYTTLMTPSTAKNIIVTSSYNQIDNTIMDNSGRGFTIDNRINPSIAIAAENILTVGLNNEPILASGSAVSGAILAGVVALLFQWGLVQKNDLNMYAAKIKSYLIQGTIREEGKVYPNPETGFGVFSIEKFYNVLEKKQKGNELQNTLKVSERNNIYIRIPKYL